jgi:ribosomal protein S18 acetylase RimI-like enzyme
MIRMLSAEDAAIFRELRLFAMRESPDSFGSTYERDVARPLEDFAERMRPREDGSAAFGYFTENQALIGLIGFARESSPKEQHKGDIWGMYVRPEHRRRQIGIQLLETVLSHVRQIPGMRQVKLTVTSSNRAAQDLYARVGFVCYGIEKDSLTRPGGFLDESLLVLSLV